MTESGERKCRICLEDEVDVRWTAVLYGYSSLSYKDCYYKHTQLKYFDENDFSTMICRNCANGLEYIDAFISKATETHVMLWEQFKNNVIEDDLIKIEPCNLATAVEEIKNNPDIKNSIYEDPNMEFDIITPDIPRSRSISPVVATNKIVRAKFKTFENSVDQIIDAAEGLEGANNPVTQIPTFEDHNMEFFITPDSPNSLSITPIVQPKMQRRPKSIRRNKKKPCKISADQTTEGMSLLDEKKLLKKSEPQPVCCTICSKVLSSKYAAVKHEKTHITNRERNEICPECGLKFFKKEILKAHILTHRQDREKKHKCEFCDKAFYNKGGLNIHRRIHLGQMISCSICTKQYSRQIDLDRHLTSHSAVRINSSVKTTEIKCFIMCKECGKSIRSTSFRSHNAMHINDPLYKCSICNKEFFYKSACVSHLKRIHKKASRGISQFIVSYRKNRTTRLYWEQNSNVKIDSNTKLC